MQTCDRKTQWHETDISGSLPPLSFSMTDAMTGAPVTAADFRGKVTLLYFGYTLCPDFCPTTLTNLAAVLNRLGVTADQVRVLFVTVDPNRDSPAVLKHMSRCSRRRSSGCAARRTTRRVGTPLSRGLFRDAGEERPSRTR